MAEENGHSPFKKLLMKKDKKGKKDSPSTKRKPKLYSSEDFDDFAKYLVNLKENNKNSDKDDHKKVSASYLRSLMPNQQDIANKFILEYMESECIKYMKLKAKSGNWDCDFHVPHQVAGYPHYDHVTIIAKLKDKINNDKDKYEDIRAEFSKKNEDSLTITWKK